MYLLIMVGNGRVNFLEEFRAIRFPKDDLFTKIERTQLVEIFGFANQLSSVQWVFWSHRAAMCKLRVLSLQLTQVHTYQRRTGYEGLLVAEGHRSVRPEDQHSLYPASL